MVIRLNPQAKEIDKKLNDNINLYKGFYYFEERLLTSLADLEDEDLLTKRELLKILKYPYTSYDWMMYSNRRYYRKGLYPVLLSDYVQEFNIKGLTNKKFFYKKDIHHIKEFLEWWEVTKEVRKEQAEYKKTMRKYFGNPSETTKECINANFDCLKCPNNELCKNYKCTVSVKQFSKMVKFLFGRTH
jgi:hypothetical protein